MSDSIKSLQKLALEFAQARDWEQFHSPKNLAMALGGEAGELLEHFQWLSEEQSLTPDDNKRQAIGYELADILIYLLRLSERLDIDLGQATIEKMAINETRYPVEKVRGDARRASEYPD